MYYKVITSNTGKSAEYDLNEAYKVSIKDSTEITVAAGEFYKTHETLKFTFPELAKAMPDNKNILVLIFGGTPKLETVDEVVGTMTDSSLREPMFPYSVDSVVVMIDKLNEAVRNVLEKHGMIVITEFKAVQSLTTYVGYCRRV
jgi:hypothetical protein